MSFVFGTALLVLAILMLGLAKYAVSRFENSSWIRRFAGTETVALLITLITAFGVAFLCDGIASNQSGLGWTELGASLGIVVLSVVAVVRVFRTASRRTAKPAAMPQKPGGPATA